MNRKHAATIVVISGLLLTGVYLVTNTALLEKLVRTETAADIRYIDGTYTATTTYSTPLRKVHEIGSTLTITDNVVTDATITYDGETLTEPYDVKNSSTQYHIRFESRYRDEVLGKTLDEITTLGRVGGASLTTTAFTNIVQIVKQQAG